MILLNGSSSSGKTSIAKQLQAKAPEPFLHFSIDDTFPWLPPQWLESAEGFRFVALSNGEMPILTGPAGERVLSAWRRMIRAAVDAGLKAIVDDVFITETALSDWVEVMTGRETFMVGVRCDLAELNRREIAREDRGIGQARWQHRRVHAYGPYDLEVDTTTTPPADCADAIIAAIAKRRGPSAFERHQALQT